MERRPEVNDSDAAHASRIHRNNVSTRTTTRHVECRSNSGHSGCAERQAETGVDSGGHSRQYASRAKGLLEIFMFLLKDNPGHRILDVQDERGIDLDVDRLRNYLRHCGIGALCRCQERSNVLGNITELWSAVAAVRLPSIPPRSFAAVPTESDP